MSVEEFWQRLDENKICVNCGMFAKGKHDDMIADLANALVDAGYKAWDGSEMTDYLRTRFCTGEYKMLKRHNINRYEVSARRKRTMKLHLLILIYTACVIAGCSRHAGQDTVVLSGEGKEAP